MSDKETLVKRVLQYIDDDVDPKAQDELRDLISAVERGDKAAQAQLQERFMGPLQFGTAGLRGLLEAGESRMNRASVIRTSYGLAKHLLAEVPQAQAKGIVIGKDGRLMSEEFQRDTAGVFAAMGFKVHLLEGCVPTPLVAFGVLHLNAAAGVMVTASHNPPRYNGYKVYWENGAQIIPPHDRGIAAQIEAAPPASAIDRVEAKSALDTEALARSYEEALQVLCSSAPVESLSIAYSAMHGVGDQLFGQVMRGRGFSQIYSVPEQAQPDGRFPTVDFPNPEEPGAMDLVLALAREKSCDLVLVNDPDADRLGVSVREPSGRYRTLSGNEIGVLLAHYVIEQDPKASEDGLVITTIVSSQLLEKLAAHHGVRFAASLTGFKWIANEALRYESSEGARFLFGYEEALGYAAGRAVRDKDGISAALVFAEMAAQEKLRGRTVLDRLQDLYQQHGLFRGRQKSVVLPGAQGAAQIQEAMATLRAANGNIEGLSVARVWDLKEESRPSMVGNVLIFELQDGARVAVRPSGTEPKIKFYLEVQETMGPQAQARADERLAALEQVMLSAAGLG